MENGSGVEQLIQFWRQFDVHEKNSQIHPEDRRFLLQNDFLLKDHDSFNKRLTFKDFVRDRRHFTPDSSALDFSLTPIPYVGDLRKAEVVILMLNPGLDYTCHYAEDLHISRGCLNSESVSTRSG